MSEESLPQHFSRHPLAWLAAHFGLGIVVRHFLDTGLTLPFVLVIIFAIAVVVKRSTARILLPLIFALLGILTLQVEIASISENRIRRIYDAGIIGSNEPVELEGYVLGSPESAFDGVFILVSAEVLRFKTDERQVTGRVRMFVPLSGSDTAIEFGELDIRNGSRIRVYCRLEREEEFQNPGVRSQIAMLDSQGIDARATIKSPLLIEKLADQGGLIQFDWIYDRRQSLIAAFRQKFSPETAGVLIASLLGDKHFLEARTAEVFRDGGTFHVLVISGLHITFIGGLAVWLVSLFSRRRTLQFTIAAIFLWAYTLAVGAEVPVVRASLMFTVLLFSLILDRRGSQLNAFGACLLLLLVLKPSDLFTPSFQLTAVSVGAIVACAFPVIEKLRAIGRWMPTAGQPFPPNVSDRLRRCCELLYWNEAVWKIENARHVWSANLFKLTGLRILTAPNLQSLTAYLIEGAVVSFIVQIWMLPLVVIYFHRVTVASIVLNLWVGIFLAAESFAGVFAVILGTVSDWLAAPFVTLTEFLNTAMIWVPALFSDLGYAGVRLPHYSGYGRTVYVLYALAVVVIARQFFMWRPFDLMAAKWTLATAIAPAAIMFLAVIIIQHPLSTPTPDGKLRIHFLDVGQGDSALVVFPDGETMLIDGGGKPLHGSDNGDETFSPDAPRIGEAVVSEFLWDQGYSRIDYIVATHADADHMQGLSDVAKNFEIGKLILGTTPLGDPEYDELMRVAGKRGIPVTVVRRGDELFVAGVKLEVLNPMTNENTASQNNLSVVLKLEYRARSFLMTGDIERMTEEKLLLGDCDSIHADIVKVPHHGSRTSSTRAFVNCTRPSIAVISVGRRSRFGHPHADVVDRWRSAKGEVMKTGENGTITIATDGYDIETGSFVP